jgi:CubicO group peptidase (beta-lactamase class C family)
MRTGKLMRDSVIGIVLTAGLLISCSGTSTGRRIQNIENVLPVVGLKDGTLTADWMQVGTLSERMKEYKIPGLSIAVVNDFKIDWAKGYGVLKAGEDNAVTTATLFEAASCTKPVSAAAALHYVKRGDLNFDQDVNEKLISWRVPDNEYTAAEKVTLKRLLTHTAGLNRPDTGFGVEEGKTATLSDVLSGRLPATNEPARVEFTPGSEHKYSNFGFILIQQLLEDVTSKSFKQIMNEVVFASLGMENSTFDVPLLEALKKRKIYHHDSDGVPVYNSGHRTALAQGGLITTPSDLALFLIEIMKSVHGRSDKIFSFDLAAEMILPHVKLDPKTKVFDGVGLGWSLLNKNGERYILHFGGNWPGTSCVIIGIPEKGQGAVIMANGYDNTILKALIFSIAREYGWELAQS